MLEMKTGVHRDLITFRKDWNCAQTYLPSFQWLWTWDFSLLNCSLDINKLPTMGARCCLGLSDDTQSFLGNSRNTTEPARAGQCVCL